MSKLASQFASYWNDLKNILQTTVSIRDIIDILVVAFVIYYAVRLVRETRAMQIVKSIAVILAVYFVASYFELKTVSFFLSTVLNFGLIVLIVLFQPELRRALEHIGRSRITDIGKFGVPLDADSALMRELIETVCKSCEYFSRRKTGALMVIEREIKLGDIIATGTVVDAKASEELICNIFFTNSPLHDGAMVIRGARVYAAGCFLPLSSNDDISRDLGTRHRAALGMSEVSDAVVVIVSEETGAISVALDSRLQRGLSPQNLGKLLGAKLLGATDTSKKSAKKAAFWKVNDNE